MARNKLKADLEAELSVANDYIQDLKGDVYDLKERHRKGLEEYRKQKRELDQAEETIKILSALIDNRRRTKFPNPDHVPIEPGAICKKPTPPEELNWLNDIWNRLSFRDMVNGAARHDKF